MQHKILCIDDETAVLFAYKRNLQKDFNFVIEDNPLNAYQRILAGERFSVIVSDYRMPQMTGVEFFEKINSIDPHAVRIIISGMSDVQMAINSINVGKVFRIITKPCKLEEFRECISSAIAQYELINAERTLLEKTVSGSIRLVADLLAMMNPELFGEDMETVDLIREYLRFINYPYSWEVVIAGMLKDIGLLTLPSDLQDKLKNKIELNEIEKLLIEKIPFIGCDLLKNIPRLENSADIIKEYKNIGKDNYKLDSVNSGSKILRIITDFINKRKNGFAKEEVFNFMSSHKELYDSEYVQKFREFCFGKIKEIKIKKENEENLNKSVVKNINQANELKIPYGIDSLVPGLRLYADIMTSSGDILVSAGMKLNSAMIQKVKNFSNISGIQQPIWIRKE